MASPWSHLGAFYSDQTFEETEASSDPDFPTLKIPRPRDLTPEPSRGSPEPNGPFFTRLPFEVRQQVLCEAFGGNTLHMDFRYDGKRNVPKYGASPADASPANSCWWGAVCHRLKPPHLRKSFDRLYGALEPAEDTCRFERPYHCKEWPGSDEVKCKIGAMGWLRSCRQAYTEGVRVLYGNNTIHMAGPQLVRNMAILLVPRRLSNITSAGDSQLPDDWCCSDEIDEAAELYYQQEMDEIIYC
ncbi:hypothetical protein LIA77_08857 [Sarocladium implicatum]|nr:hypothetical protein LIA77_08857 [Sarocladium implicatum]